MIVSFYDNHLVGVKNNASLKIDNKSYKLIKRPIELNELTCTCEAFREDMQPTFLVVEDEIGNYVYGCLAGVPVLNENNQTEIHGTDLKSILSSDFFLDMDIGNIHTTSVRMAIDSIFVRWVSLYNTALFDFVNIDMVFGKELDPNDPDYDHEKDPDAIKDLKLEDYKSGIYNALEEIQKFLRYYDLYMDTEIDIINKKILFKVGCTMAHKVNLNLRELDVKNYGKIVADVNEAQGIVVKNENDAETWYTRSYDGIDSIRWILTSQNDLTDDPTKRDIFPPKLKLVSSTVDMYEANKLALEALLDMKYNEDIDLSADVIKADLKRFENQKWSLFSARFDVYTESGLDAELYKSLPCGELEYDANNELVRFKTGYRYTSVNFI